MKYFSIRPIVIDPRSVNLEALRKELGEGQVVLHESEETKPAEIQMSMTRDNQLAMKGAVIDETTLDAMGEPPITVQSLAQEIVDAHDKNASSILDGKNHRIAAAKILMNGLISDQAKIAFETDDREAWNAWTQSWTIRSSRPADYVSAGLFVIHSTTSFNTPGAALSVEADIGNYYDELMNERVIPFDKFKEVKVQEYLTTKASIEAE